MKKKEQSGPSPENAAPQASLPEKDAAENAASDGATEKDPRQTMREDIDLFHSLFPGVAARDIPQEVWDEVEKGRGLAASFALYTVKKEREEERIRKVNEENDKKAPPKVDAFGGDEDYFSPEAVKNMTRSEIRKNYDKILSSMEKWN